MERGLQNVTLHFQYVPKLAGDSLGSPVSEFVFLPKLIGPSLVDRDGGSILVSLFQVENYKVSHSEATVQHSVFGHRSLQNHLLELLHVLFWRLARKTRRNLLTLWRFGIQSMFGSTVSILSTNVQVEGFKLRTSS